MSENIKEFYNEFSKKQLATGVNLRHYYLFRKIIQSGLKRNHNVLEIGCRIGTFTGLLARYLKKGKILAADISPENIKIAKERLKNRKNVEFLISDMQDFQHHTKFDFVVLADVLEHIPRQHHVALFQTISRHMTEEAVLFINIPHPKNIEYLEKYHPEKLQIIDQALYADEIITAAFQNGLILNQYVSYKLYHKENDYITIQFEKNKFVSFNSLMKKNIILKKIKYRLYNWILRF
ncbi:MAG: class I SAM-dependent methyltransferase [Bacteroidia bacterium]|nr:class I SAM-dependent methyltransferase [Bacteroidia bacterium]